MLLLALFACTNLPDDTDKPDDTEPDDTAAENRAPGAAEIAITPESPVTGEDLHASVITNAVDPDGDPVRYVYSWTVDGVDSGVTGARVPGGGSAPGQVWEVTVIATDEVTPGPPATASVVIGNAPPTAPGLAIQPDVVLEGSTLTLVLDPPASDPDGDALTTTILWYENGVQVPELDDLTTVDGTYVHADDTFRAVVTVSDGTHEPVSAEVSASVTSYNCSNLPPEHLGDRTMSNARAYHGVSFDDEGNLLGYDGRGSIVKSAYDGGRDVFVPGVGTVQQIDRFPDGTWAYADNSRTALMRLDESGGTEVISSNVGAAYGVVVGPDQKVWIANGGISRVDPETGEVEEILAARGSTVHTIEFNLDSTQLYIGVIGASTISVLELDANLDPVGEPSVFATITGSGWHDGLGVDTCGNVYVADYSSRGLYRISPDGSEVTNMVGNEPTAYGHGLQWGSGVGGWRTDTLYQPQPYNGNTVREVVVGFQTGDTVRTWNGTPVPW